MADTMTHEARHECMSHIRSVNTSPERIVRSELWRKGYRYRLNDKRLPGTPDLVLPKYRAVIFINGCFWHGHAGCRMNVIPKTNTEFWKLKIARNRERDLLNLQRLDALAWTAIVIWECELSKKKLASTIERVENELHLSSIKWDEYCALRRNNRQFALEQSRRAKKIRELISAELKQQFSSPIPFNHSD